jgi:TonB family protein
MLQERPKSVIDKRFKYFFAGSFFIHALFILSVFIYQIIVPHMEISTITLNLGMSGGNGAPVKQAEKKKARQVVHKQEEKMVLPSKQAVRKQAAEEITRQTVTAAATAAAVQTGAGGTGTGYGEGQGVVSSNELDSQPSLVKFKDPVYPVEARKQGIEGVVLLKALIAPDGRIKDVKVLKSIPVFDEYAVDAVKQWRFTGITSHGNPVYVWMIIPIRFKLK